MKDILDAVLLDYSLDWLDADSYSGRGFSSEARSKEIYGALLKVNSFSRNRSKNGIIKNKE